MIHGTAASVWTLLTTVGRPNRPRSARVRRPLLGLAALALERLEQDRLLAQHVGALDGPDGDRPRRSPLPRTSSPRKPASSAAAIAPSSRRDELGVLAADGEDRLVGADRRTRRSPGPRGPPTGRRPRSARSVRTDGIRAVAVRDDVALVARLVGGGAPLLAGGEAARRRGRAARTPRRSAMVPVAPRSRTAWRSARRTRAGARSRRPRSRRRPAGERRPRVRVEDDARPVRWVS